MSYDNHKDGYFTAGELANLFGISKQTLLYYDKIDLLSPDYICEKGYRHYAIQQYLDLEIIVNLRSFNMSIADIRAYLRQRSKKDFMLMLKQKQMECEAIIQENLSIIKSLDTIYQNVEKDLEVPFNKPLLNYYEERLMKVTPVDNKDDGKDRIILFTKHAQNNFHTSRSLEKHVGWVISPEDFFVEKGYFPTKAFFSFISTKHKLRSKRSKTLPAGDYLEIYFKGTYYKNFSSLVMLINNYIEENGLEVVSDVYILTIENHLFYNETDEYINKIFLKVQKK